MCKLYDVGYDPGNSETSTVVITPDGEQLVITIPSYIGRGSSDNLKRFRNMNSIQADDTLQPGEYILHCPAVDNSEVFVGVLAQRQSHRSTSAFGDNNRYWDHHSLPLLLTTTAALIRDAKYVIDLGTGMPIETYSGTNRRKIRDALEGEHHFTLNGQERVATVNVEKVIMEGAGAMIAFGDDRPLRQAVVDIGGRTTDLYTSDGQIPLIPLCRGIPLGVELAAEIISDTFRTQYGRLLTPQEIRSVLRAWVNGGHYSPIYAHGQEVSPINLKQLAEGALRSVGRDITTFVSQTWASGELGAVAADMAKVLLVGGGAYYFYQDIARLIPHVTVPEKPELANALGYAALARHLRLRREGH